VSSPIANNNNIINLRYCLLFSRAHNAMLIMIDSTVFIYVFTEN